MNFEKNGQQSDKNRQSDGSHAEDSQFVDDDVKLTALAMGEDLDPAEANRLQALLDKDDSKRQEFESTSHLAALIRDSVENDLPMAPGSIHDVVVAALAGDALPESDLGNADDPPRAETKDKSSGMVVAASHQQTFMNGKLYYYVAAASVLIVAFGMLYFPDWNGEPVNLARHEGNTSNAGEEARSANSMLEDLEIDANENYEFRSNKAVGDQVKLAQQDSFDFNQAQKELSRVEKLGLKGQAGQGQIVLGQAMGNSADPFGDQPGQKKFRGVNANGGIKAPSGKNNAPGANAPRSGLGPAGGQEADEKMPGRRVTNTKPSFVKPALVEPASQSGGEAGGGGRGRPGIGGGLGGGGGFAGGSKPDPARFFQERQARGGRVDDSRASGDDSGSARGFKSGGMVEKKLAEESKKIRSRNQPASNANNSGGVAGFKSTNKAGAAKAPESNKAPSSSARKSDKDFAIRESESPMKRKALPSPKTPSNKRYGLAPADKSEGKTFGRDAQIEQSIRSKNVELKKGKRQDAGGATDGAKQSSPKLSAAFGGKSLEKKDAKGLKSESGKASGKKEDGKWALPEPLKENDGLSLKLAESKNEKGQLNEQLGAIKKFADSNKNATDSKAPAKDEISESESRNSDRFEEKEKKSETEDLGKDPDGSAETYKKKLSAKKGFEGIALDFPKIDPTLENDFIKPIGTDAVSTFSADTDTASYTIVRQALRAGRLPHPEEVRIEEMINYFDFKYKQPKSTEPFSVNMEVATAPWNPSHKILRIGLQARTITNESRPLSNLVFLVDVSGSMRANNKLPLLKSGLKKMVQKLREDDYVSIVTYSDKIKTVLEPTDGTQKDKITGVIDRLAAGGSTNGGEGLQTAYKLAEKNLLKNGTNRIILGTDGDFNVGIQNDKELAEFVKSKAQSGVFLTVCGFGTDNFKDTKMQTMANNGNGKVYYIDSAEEAQRVFVDRISGSLVTIAKNVKLQMLFNPRMVQSYRLIGYENRIMKTEDFDDDSKDAGEMDAGDSVTALYEIVPGDGDFKFPTTVENKESVDLKYQVIQKAKMELTKVAASNDLAALRIRYIPPEQVDEEESRLREFVVKNKQAAFNRASKEFQLATAVAGLGLMLRGSQHRGGLNYDNLKEFGQTVLAERPEKTDESKTEKQTVLESVRKLTEQRTKQRAEVLELIDRAAEIYQRKISSGR